MTLGRLLQTRRAARELSLRDVARLLQGRGVRGADFWCIGLMERDGRVPSLTQFAHLVQVLEISRPLVRTALELCRVSTGLPLPVPGPCRWHPSTPRPGILLRRRRAEMFLSADQVARRLRARGVSGMDEAHVLHWERGERTPLLGQLAHLFEVLEFDGHAIGLLLGQVAGCVLSGLPVPQHYDRSDDRPARLDVGERYDQCRRVLRTLPEWRGALRAGLDAEDLEQDTLAALVRRQRPRADGLVNWSAYDPARSGLSHYLHVAMRGLVLHAIEAAGADRRRRERPGAWSSADDMQVDASTVAVDHADPTDALDSASVGDQVVAVVVDELGDVAGEHARALIDGGDVERCPKAVRELVRELLQGRS